MNATAYAFLSWQRPAVLLVSEYECVDPVSLLTTFQPYLSVTFMTRVACYDVY